MAFETLKSTPDLLEFCSADIGPHAEFHSSDVTSVSWLYHDTQFYIFSYEIKMLSGQYDPFSITNFQMKLHNTRSCTIKTILKPKVLVRENELLHM